jgi:ABC-type sugar transport system ATPase subunit
LDEVFAASVLTPNNRTLTAFLFAGLEPETTGTVMIGERRVNGRPPPRQRSIAIVFRNYAVFPHMTVRDTIVFGLRMKKAWAGLIERQVARSAELMHILQLRDRDSGQLWGGQRQRAAVGRGQRLACRPDFGTRRERPARVRRHS